LLYNIQAQDSAGQIIDAGQQIQVCHTEFISIPPLLAISLGDNHLGSISLISNLGVYVEVDFGDGHIEVVVAVRNVLSGLLQIDLFHTYASLGVYPVRLLATCNCGGQNLTDTVNVNVTVTGSCGTFTAPSGPIAEGETFKAIFVPSANFTGMSFTATANFSLNGNLTSNQEIGSFSGVQIFGEQYGQSGSAAASIVVTAMTNGVADPTVCMQTFTSSFVVQGSAPKVFIKPLGLLSIGTSLVITGGFSDAGFDNQFAIDVYLTAIKVNCQCQIVTFSTTDYAFSFPIRQYLLLGVANVRVIVRETAIGGQSGVATTSGLVVGLGNLLNDLGLGDLGLNV